MLLVDTSVWIDFLRKGEPLLSELLSESKVYTHPFVIGELRLGNISKRKQFLELIGDLPQCTKATDEEVVFLIEENKLYGRGIGYTDAHILASSMLSDCPLWTLDKRLDSISKELKGTNNKRSTRDKLECPECVASFACLAVAHEQPIARPSMSSTVKSTHSRTRKPQA